MSIDFEKSIIVFTDGACSGNPGPGGFGVVIVTPEGQVTELGEGRSSTTNNRMEMVAIVKALEFLKKRSEPLWILTDSAYVIRGITGWVFGWRKRGWKTAEGQEVANRDVWETLFELVEKRKKLGPLNWGFVRGHSGVPGNERCDEIAVKFTKNQAPTLYEGPLLNYPVPVHDIPEDLSLPPMKERSAKKKAYSYLSLVDGVLERHTNWGECEARVKGRSGARFKKSTSAEDEAAILGEWGLDPDSFSEGH